jgi:hypothetical protein
MGEEEVTMIRKARPVRSSLALEKVRQRFVRWRQDREPRARIPERLWTAAIGRARASGLNRTARALHLDYYSLKNRLEAGVDKKTQRRRSASGQRLGRGSTRQAFVEVPALNLVARSALTPFVPMDTGGTGAECHLIVDSSAGARLTVILARADAALIDAVCRSVLGQLNFPDQTMS